MSASAGLPKRCGTPDTSSTDHRRRRH
jgi:hypothetical protein